MTTATAVSPTQREPELLGHGGTFPDYELTDHTKTRRLSELQGIDPRTSAAICVR